MKRVPSQAQLALQNEEAIVREEESEEAQEAWRRRQQQRQDAGVDNVDAKKKNEPLLRTKDLWFQPEEYDEIKRKTMALIRAVQENDTGGVTYCTRGLERYFSVEDVQDQRNNAWDSVLDEQDLQRDHEVYDDDRLSEAYSNVTRRSSLEALERGKRDQSAIERYVKKTRQQVRRTYSMPIYKTKNLEHFS